MQMEYKNKYKYETNEIIGNNIKTGGTCIKINSILNI